MAEVPILIHYGGSWIKLWDGSEAYRGGNVASLLVPKDVKYQEFLHILYDRFGINPAEFTVKARTLYKMSVPSSMSPYALVDIRDDGGLKAFINVNINYVSALEGLTPVCITSERRGPKEPRNNQVSDVNGTLPVVQGKKVGHATPTGGPRDPRNNPVSDVNDKLREKIAGCTNLGPRDPRNNPVCDVNDKLPAVRVRTFGRTTPTGPEHCSAPHHNGNPKDDCSDSESTTRAGKKCRRNYREEPTDIRKDVGAGDSQPQAHSRQRSNSLACEHNIPSSSSLFKNLPPIPSAFMRADTSLDDLGQEFIYDGQLFDNKQDLRKKLSIVASQQHFKFKISRSTKDRFELKCLDNQCHWRFRAVSVKDDEDKDREYFEDRMKDRTRL
ncbi:protein FAR1-RELATED SEQUENCE 4-like [Melia azedarach]|uniref:Protein FAR1-RELATED SEQUENCE 4-like n=1 Tax=Melia azedarach TaxID=155640 RepID=A0ACC1XP35_MELAZ|nr:protein FAR1-RELATED SEQUENCE 4-like [Melia azedarach]